MNPSSMLVRLSLFGALASTLACSTHEAAAEGPAPVITSQPLLEYTGFAGPERVLHDAVRDRYLVSNVNGDANAADGNGFISVLSPDGEVSDLKWIEGGKHGVELDAPKGLAVNDGVLYVADISRVRLFDAESGAPVGEIAIPGSTFLNGVTVDASGTVYVTDSGPPQGSLDARGTEAVHRIDGDTVTTLAGGSLGRPTSITAGPAGLLVAPFGDSAVYRLDAHGKKQSVTHLPAQGLAGVVALGDWLFVSSWQASAVFRGKLGRTFEVALEEQASPTDLGFDGTRARFLVPHYTEDRVDVYEVH